jgi:hypothetical protein
MKIFVSWSGSHSRDVAEHLKNWIEGTFDGTNVWYSKKDINRGEEWATVIRKQLVDTHVGILCLTEENQNRPWILFEAGAISKQLDKACVIPLLIGIETQLEPPLSMFQAAIASEVGIADLFWAINEKHKHRKFSRKAFDVIFKDSWKKNGKKFLEIVDNHKPSKPQQAPEPI